MTAIVPRWEWRSFGRSFGEAEKRLAALPPQGVQESDEQYLLTASGANVKVRAALMDIKELKQVNADGLEQWMPVLKAGFPLPAAETARVLEALRLPPPSQPHTSDSLEQFLDEFAKPARRGPRGDGPQAAHALHGGRLHGRTLRCRGQRHAHAHPRRRVRRRGGGNPVPCASSASAGIRTPPTRAAWRRSSTVRRHALR